MRSKFFVRAVKRGDYDSRCACHYYGPCPDGWTEGQESDYDGHRDRLWVVEMISYAWGARAKPLPASRSWKPQDAIACRWDDGGNVMHYRLRRPAEGRKLFSEYSRRRKKR